MILAPACCILEPQNDRHWYFCLLPFRPSLVNSVDHSLDRGSRRMNTSVGQQLMAPLSLCRTEQGWWSFAFIGLHYFGLIQVRNGRELEKCGCLLTCLQTRVVHLEVACKLDTEFIVVDLMSRRGAPREKYKDNCTKFVGCISEPKDGVICQDKKN